MNTTIPTDAAGIERYAQVLYETIGIDVYHGILRAFGAPNLSAGLPPLGAQPAPTWPQLAPALQQRWRIYAVETLTAMAAR